MPLPTDTGTPTVPFGFGLSYTNFSYSVSEAAGSVQLDRVDDLIAAHAGRPFPPQAATDSAGAVAQHKVTVTNTGSRDADHVVLGILKPPGAGQGGVPLQSLYDFARVHVRAGQSVTVALNASALDFTQVDETGQRAEWVDAQLATGRIAAVASAPLDEENRAWLLGAENPFQLYAVGHAPRRKACAGPPPPHAWRAVP